MDDIKLPIIRKSCPAQTAERIFSIAPNVGESFGVEFFGEPKVYKFGDLIHDCVDGYMVHNGVGFISICEFVQLYGKESIKSFNEEGL